MSIYKILLGVFYLPAMIDIFSKISKGDYDFDLVLILVALVTSAVGSTVQISHKNLEKNILKKEVFAIYSTSIMVAIISYFLGVWTNKVFVTALVSTIGSYMSLELLKSIEGAVKGILNIAPELFKMFVKSKFNLKDDDDEDRNRYS